MLGASISEATMRPNPLGARRPPRGEAPGRGRRRRQHQGSPSSPRPGSTAAPRYLLVRAPKEGGRKPTARTQGCARAGGRSTRTQRGRAGRRCTRPATAAAPAWCSTCSCRVGQSPRSQTRARAPSTSPRTPATLTWSATPPLPPAATRSRCLARGMHPVRPRLHPAAVGGGSAAPPLTHAGPNARRPWGGPGARARRVDAPARGRARCPNPPGAFKRP